MMPDKRTTGEASTGKLGQTMVDCDGALVSTAAILAQGSNWAVAISQAFFWLAVRTESHGLM